MLEFEAMLETLNIGKFSIWVFCGAVFPKIVSSNIK